MINRVDRVKTNKDSLNYMFERKNSYKNKKTVKFVIESENE